MAAPMTDEQVDAYLEATATAARVSLAKMLAKVATDHALDETARYLGITREELDAAVGPQAPIVDLNPASEPRKR